MRALSGLGIGLAVVSSLLFLALAAELYYIFWWKKRLSNSNPNFAPKSNYCLLSKLKLLLSLSHSLPLRSRTNPTDVHQSQAQSPINGLAPQPAPDLSSKDALLKASFNGEEAIDAELMRLHSLSGPPRFLFTIKEETKEDLESDDGRSRGGRSRKGSRGRSLGDLLHCAETPFLTPLSSPPLLGISAHSLVNLDVFKKLGFNPLFESSSSSSPPPKFKFLKDAEEKLSSSSPPPKFKFLKDAEEKLQRRIGLLEGSRAGANGDGESGQFTVTMPLPSDLASIKTEQ